MYNIGKKIRLIRQKSGFSQQQLADKTSVKRSSIAKIEREDQRPPLDFLIKVVTLCNITLDELVNMEAEDLGLSSTVNEEHIQYKQSPTAAYQYIHQLVEEGIESERNIIGRKVNHLITQLIDENAALKSEMISILKKLNDFK